MAGKDKPPTGGEDASEEASDDASGMRADATQDASSGKLQGGMDASEMARLRWAKQRERESAIDEPQSADRVLISQTPTEVDKIMRGLHKEAVKGNANSAREYRAWLEVYPPLDMSMTPERLDSALRERLLARLLKEIAEEDAAQEQIRREQETGSMPYGEAAADPPTPPEK